MKKGLRTLLIWLILVMGFTFLFRMLNAKPTPFRQWPVFQEHVQKSMVRLVRRGETYLHVTLHSGAKYRTLGAIDTEMYKRLFKSGVQIKYKNANNSLRDVLVYGAILLCILIAVFYYLRKKQGQSGSWMSLLKSPARQISQEKNVTFADVGGCQQAKELFSDLIDFLKNPERWESSGARLPRGVLLEGPSGCGKTLMARALAGETKAQFFVLSASEFVEMFVGVGAARVRDLFETASKNAPAVVFIDELDAVGRRRGSGLGAGHDEREQTLNQLLVCLDGFEQHQRVVVVGATNRHDLLDQALSRPGRFDRSIKIPLPNVQDRLEILQIHTRQKSLHPDISLETWAERTDGFHGAMLENLVNEALLHRIRLSKPHGNTEKVQILNEDLEFIFAQRKAEKKTFNQLDSLLIESMTQLAEPTGRIVARLHLGDQTSLEGEVLWAHSGILKLRVRETHEEFLIAKDKIMRIEALEGTENADDNAVREDIWANKQPGLA